MFLASYVVPQPLHILSLCFPLKLFFTSSILVLALNNLWCLPGIYLVFPMYFGRFPIFLSLILSSRTLTFDIVFV